MSIKDDDNNKKGTLFCAVGSETSALSDDEIRQHIDQFLDSMGAREDVLILPPDYTRFHSQAGKITRMVCEHYNFVAPPASGEEPAEKKAKTSTTTPPTIEILPALGTHAPMTQTQIASMFGEKLAEKQPSPFLVHEWRKDVVTIGHVPNQMVSGWVGSCGATTKTHLFCALFLQVLDATRGLVDEPWPAQLNKKVWEKRNHDPEKQPHKSLVLSIGQVVPHEGRYK